MAFRISFSDYLNKGDKDKDEFRLNVGNLAPGQEATVLLRYITELQSEGEALKFSLPITRSPIVTSENKATSTTSTTKSGEGLPAIADGLHVTVNIKSAAPILGIEPESSHHLDSKIEGNTAVVTYTSSDQKPTSFETFRFIVGFTESFRPRLLFETEVNR